MYFQQSSENPIRTNTRNLNCKHPNLKFPTARPIASSLRIGVAKPIKSVLATVMAVVLFVGAVLGAYCIEGSINVGFKPDFQSNTPFYSSVNSLFDNYNDMVSVTISLHGANEFGVTSPIVTVGEAIDKLSLTLSENDVVNYSLDDKITDGMEITIDRVEKKERTETTVIPYPVRYVDSQTIPKGTTQVITEGVNGSATQTFEDTYVNGELISSEVIASTDAVEPVEGTAYKGVGGTYTDSMGNTYSYSYYIDVTATAYGVGTGLTATGKVPEIGMIAVDPRVIPLGTQVYVTGSWGDMGVCSAEDTGGVIKGNKIDVFLGDDFDLIRQFGRRSMRVYILG